MNPNEVEVFRLTTFDKEKCYEFALSTRNDWRNNKYYTTNPLQYIGKYVSSERWGSGDGSGGAENFIDDNGNNHRIEYDYDGKTCFREVDCKDIIPKGGKSNRWKIKS